MLGILLLIGLCAAAVVVGWSLLLASLLYVVSDYSAGTWLVTSMGLAVAHVVLAAACWHYAVGMLRKLAARQGPAEIEKQSSPRETGR